MISGVAPPVSACAYCYEDLAAIVVEQAATTTSLSFDFARVNERITELKSQLA
jgi:hypothetical protein